MKHPESKRKKKSPKPPPLAGAPGGGGLFRVIDALQTGCYKRSVIFPVASMSLFGCPERLPSLRFTRMALASPRKPCFP
jgi:hypothetical protein